MIRPIVHVPAIGILALALALAGAGCTNRSNKVTRFHADQVKVGMHEGQVTDILGAPSESAEAAGAKQMVWKDGVKAITVILMNGQVTTTVFVEDATKEKSVPSPLDQPLLTQTGTFTTIANEEAVVNFPIPYALPPNVELSSLFAGMQHNCVVKDVTATGFKWKCVGTGGNAVNWAAKGVKATKLP